MFLHFHVHFRSSLSVSETITMLECYLGFCWAHESLGVHVAFSDPWRWYASPGLPSSVQRSHTLLWLALTGNSTQSRVTKEEHFMEELSRSRWARGRVLMTVKNYLRRVAIPWAGDHGFLKKGESKFSAGMRSFLVFCFLAVDLMCCLLQVPVCMTSPPQQVYWNFKLTKTLSLLCRLCVSFVQWQWRRYSDTFHFFWD